MATELSPYERDIVRLRFGLDDGVSRTAKQVGEVCGGNISPWGTLLCFFGPCCFHVVPF